MSWIKKSDIALVIFSCFVGLGLVEAGFLLITDKSKEFYKWDRRYMLFKQEDQGPVFKNINNIFVYQPNQTIESTTFYYVENQWTMEYDYIIPTNNLGLVQTNPTVSNKDSLLILGDSFTEGQGAYPWFENFREDLKTDLQLINGGILSTGFQSWKILLNFLIDNDIQIKRIIIIFISDDYLRGVWNVPDQTLACIQNTETCIGNENFYGKPNAKDLNVFLEKLKSYRESHFIFNVNSFKLYLKNLLPGTATIYSFIKSESRKLVSTAETSKNDIVIREFVAAYGPDVLFIHIPQKDELTLKKPNIAGQKVVNEINSARGLIFDGHAKCGFDQNDYFVNDGHPNERGYEKLAECVKMAIRLHWNDNPR